MRGQLLTRYGVLAGLLAGLACAGNSARTDETTVAADTTKAENPPAYSAPIRDTTMSAVSDSTKPSQATEIKPGESTVTTDTTKTQLPAEQSQPVVPATTDSLRTTSDTTQQ
jgi:hypothetical protein